MMRAFVLGVAMLCTGAQQSAPERAPGPALVPVLVELFTSEGCSSCPPADVLLSALAKEPRSGAQVIPLGLHVDYWDELGWKDPASLRQATARQSAYASALGLGDRIYTPQLVVDGRDEMVGTDGAAAARAIASALKRPRARMTVSVGLDGDALVARAAVADVPPDAAKEPLDAVLALTEDDVTHFVKRGENTGRTLHHDAVVRALLPMGTLRGAGEVQQRAALDPAWRRDRMRAVVFLQGHKSQRIWGAGSASFEGSTDSKGGRRISP